MAVKHLHNLGHKKIAFINGSLFSLVSDQRQEAFENSMRDAGLEIYPELMGRHSRFFESKQFYLDSMETERFELSTPCLQGRCSPN